ncbi:hypothetical protein LTR36_006295 [Oleoguttula mirabilis]|uniref:Uncharacterized protein n=1 Tax=Oleoguttula mirabilis TaxID=1507867 RepID=A0AAV9JD47_9PEZI|nr:hypothetical protein LTR36_006295 [Oleoguttula mirabilis]
MERTPATLQEKLRRRGARFRSNLERDLASIKPVKQDVLTHDTVDGSILEPLLVWITQELRALDRLFKGHGALDRLRKRLREQTSEGRLGRKITVQHLKRVLSAFQTERQAKCAGVLSVARTYVEKEDAERAGLRKEVEQALEARRYAEHAKGQYCRSLEKAEENHKRVHAESIQDKKELEEAWIREAALQEQLTSVNRNLEQEQTRRISATIRCESLTHECLQAADELVRQEERSTKLAEEAGQSFAQTSHDLEKAGAENAHLRMQLEDEQACSSKQLVVASLLTAEKDAMTTALVRLREEAGVLTSQVQRLRGEAEQHVAGQDERIASMAQDIMLLSSKSRALQSTLNQERNRSRELWGLLDESGAKCARVARERDLVVDELQACDSIATAQRLQLTAALREKEVDLERIQSEHVSALRPWEDRLRRYERAHSTLQEETQVLKAKCSAATREIDEATAERDKLQEELVRARKLVSTLESGRAFQVPELNQAKRTIQELQAQCEGYQCQVRDCVYENETLRNAADRERARLSKQLEDAMSKVRLLDTHLAAEQRQLGDVGRTWILNKSQFGRRSLDIQVQEITIPPPDAVVANTQAPAQDQCDVRPLPSQLPVSMDLDTCRDPEVSQNCMQSTLVRQCEIAAHEVLGKADRLTFRPLLPIS